MFTPGWYPDPLGRFDLRFHNGTAWTADVSADGDRFVDPLGLSTPPASPRAGDPDGPDSTATTGMVLGIVAVSLAWMPFLVVIGLVTGILALALGVTSLRRSVPAGRGRAVAAVAMGASAIAASVLGVLLTIIVLDVYGDYVTPGPHETEVTECDIVGSRASMTGELVNLGDETADYSVLIGFYRAGTNSRHASARAEVDDVEPGATATFDVQHQVDLEEVECRVLEVNGPLPFGISLD